MLIERTNAATAHEGPLESLPSDLEALTDALRAAGRALAMSGARVVPAAESHDEGVCRRYQRAAVMWPTDPPPSHERFAAALAHLHAAAATTQLAARHCDEARQTVEALLRGSQHAGSS